MNDREREFQRKQQELRAQRRNGEGVPVVGVKSAVAEVAAAVGREGRRKLYPGEVPSEVMRRKLLTLAEAAGMLAIDVKTFKRHAERALLPKPFRLNSINLGHWYVDATELDRAIDRAKEHRR